MKRFTVRRQGMILGTYPGEDEDAALDRIAKDQGHDSFKAFCAKTGLKRDHHTVEEVKE